MRVLVTGGAGYIGAHTAKALFRAGHHPIVFDNLSAGQRASVRWGPLIEGELSNGPLLRTVLARERIDAVIHLAGSAYVGESMNNPRKYFRNNVGNTLTLLEAMADQRVSLIVFSSSCATYGDPCRLPIEETHPQCPVNPYGESKLFVEKALRWHGSINSWRWLALRYFNAAGADPEGEIGENHSPETHIFPLAIQTALGLSEHIDVFGGDYATRDGTAIRDYVHVTDIAEAHVNALHHLADGGKSAAINLGTGAGTSVREVIEYVQKLAGKPVPIRWAPRRDGDPAILIADGSLSRSLLDCSYRNSNVETIAQTAWRWHASQKSTPERVFFRHVRPAPLVGVEAAPARVVSHFGNVSDRGL